MKVANLLFPVTALFLAPIYALADSSPINWGASVDLGVKNLEFEEDRVLTQVTGPAVGAVTRVKKDFEEHLYYTGLGLGVIYEKFYTVARIEIPLDDVGVSVENERIIDTGPVAVPDDEGNMERLDWSITAGYQITDSIKIFGGYKYGQTELDFDFVPLGGVPENFEGEYEEDGFFLGADYTLPVGSMGALTFSIAYADLDAEFSTSGVFGNPGSADNVQPYLQGPIDYDGDADGFSFGLRWTAGLTESLLYNIALRYQEYDMSGDGRRTDIFNPNLPEVPPSGPERIWDMDIDTTETITTLSAGITYAF